MESIVIQCARFRVFASWTPFAKCGLCRDFYTSPVRITQCGHSYCHKCLMEMISAGQDEESSEYSYNGEDFWKCPECRTEHDVSPVQLTRIFALERVVWNYKDSMNYKEFNELQRFNECTIHKWPNELRKYLFSQSNNKICNLFEAKLQFPCF